jgi:putative transposase
VSCYRLIDAEKPHHQISRLCRVLGVARAGYYAWASRSPSQRTLEDAYLGDQIRQIHARSRGTYGGPRVHAELRLGLDVHVSRKRVARLMRDHGLQGVHRRRRHGSTRRDPTATPAPDLVERNFLPPGPDRLWVADITQQRTDQGWLYLAVILDAFSRRVVGWSMAEHLRTELVLDALDMAISQRQPAPGLVCHSDHGCQGGFKQSSQHLDSEGLRWEPVGVDGLIGRCVLQCVHLVDHRWHAASIDSGSGRRSPVACRVRSLGSRPACLRRSGLAGSVKVVGCQRSARFRFRAASCPLSSGKRSLSCRPRATGSAISLGG